MRFPGIILTAGLVLACALTPACAEKRVALVIGNDRYPNLSSTEQLQKAVNDARSVGTALKQIGFDVVLGENLGRQALLARLDDAAQRLAPGDTAFFFFSGHGIAVDGTNYILPADIPTIAAGQIASLTGAAIREEDITSRFLRAGALVTIVVLDACRNNPFSGSGAKGIGGERGLAPHEPPSGVFTLYAASRGETALDRLYDGDRNPNSIFTRALLPALARPGLDLPGLALEVRKEVTRLAHTINHTQRPAYYDETSGDRIFLAGAMPVDDRPAAPQSPTKPGTTATASVKPMRALGCMIAVIQYPTNLRGTPNWEEISVTELLETKRTNPAKGEVEVAFKEGGRAWVDEAQLKKKRAGGQCPAPTFEIREPTHNIQ
jgi:uncharacterized caspase-like protein